MQVTFLVDAVRVRIPHRSMTRLTCSLLHDINVHKLTVVNFPSHSLFSFRRDDWTRIYAEIQRQWGTPRFTYSAN